MSPGFDEILFPIKTPTEVIISDAEWIPSAIIAVELPITPANTFIIDKNKEKERVNSYIDRIRIKTPSIEQLIKNLSGGNQQKVAIAKALMIHPDVLILDEPTRGVDVGAKKEIYDLINEFKAQGKAIIMISSEMPELLGLSDRVLVLSHGQITGEFDIKDATQEKILKCAVNIKEDNRDVISGKTTA